MHTETNKHQQTEIQTRQLTKPTFQTRFGNPFCIWVLTRPDFSGAPSVQLHSASSKNQKKKEGQKEELTITVRITILNLFSLPLRKNERSESLIAFFVQSFLNLHSAEKNASPSYSNNLVRTSLSQVFMTKGEYSTRLSLHSLTPNNAYFLPFLFLSLKESLCIQK